MRVLVTIQPAVSHLHTVAPLARELLLRGHDVRVATSDSFGPVVRSLDLPALAAGPDWEASRADESLPGFRRARPRSQARLLAELAGRGTIDDLVALARDWPPEIVIRDSYEYGGAVLAAALGVPVAVAGVGIRPPVAWLEQALDSTLERYWHHYRLPSREARALVGDLWLSSYPSSLSWEADLSHEQHVRPASVSDGNVTGSTAPHGEADVYLTLGTVFNAEIELFRRMATALGDAGLRVIVTTGRNVPPSRLGVLPASVRAAGYVPQGQLMPVVRAVVSHGGFNTIMGALTHGVPVCSGPLSADQPVNAARCADAGVGTVVTTLSPPWGFPHAVARDVTGDAVVAAVMPLFENPSYTVRARALATELAGLSGPPDVAQLVEALAGN